jgi:hypothetical protein
VTAWPGDGTRQRRREISFPPGTPMSPVQEQAFRYTVAMTKDELAGMLGTYSGVITLGDDARSGYTRRVRDYLDRLPWERGDVPMACRARRSTRLP